ncbi:MAG: hypothetical protein IPQ07_11285 [Myxococcales bacterium]|nr:hypothetical protein [Myxococcales bacterium]
MPPLTLIKPAGAAIFLAHGLKLPSQFKPPSGNTAQEHYKQAWGPENKVAVPQLIPPWFMPAEQNNKCYQDSCDKIGNDFKTFHDKMLDAVMFAHSQWKLQAKFQNIQIMAVSAIGTPGCLSGPDLESLIKNAPICASFTGNMAKHRDAVAKGVAQCFKKWQDGVTVPGLPWYPAFAAFPGPMAPPIPNVPTPLITCLSPAAISICAPTDMKSAMDNALDGGLKSKDNDKQYEALHDAIATVLSAAFTIWLAAQQVMLVMGKGPIPSFAPPYVPVGPVVGGDIISAPGHLIS